MIFPNQNVSFVLFQLQVYKHFVVLRTLVGNVKLLLQSIHICDLSRKLLQNFIC